MTPTERSQHFASLHIPGTPVLLYNIWDAGSAKAVCDAGAAAVATGSWSVAAAQGYADGENIPLGLLETLVRRIVATVDVPVTVDFEGGYAAAPEAVAENVARILDCGAIGINFEDRVVGGEGLYSIDDQSQRIAAIRKMSETTGRPVFLNARTDLFLKEQDPEKHTALIAPALERATAYAEAGASSFFVPGLVDGALIGQVCESTSLPVNVMKKPGTPDLEALGRLGVARVSYGPGPYFLSVAALEERFRGLR